MVSENVTARIEKVFPNVEIDQNYDEHEACVLIDELHPHKLQELIDAFSNSSGCMWFIKGDTDLGKAQVIFKHVAFSN